MPEENFIALVAEMRNLQKEYFSLAGQARKNPAKWDEARTVLSKSKAKEAEVDQQLAQLSQEVPS